MEQNDPERRSVGIVVQIQLQILAPHPPAQPPRAPLRRAHPRKRRHPVGWRASHMGAVAAPITGCGGPRAPGPRLVATPPATVAGRAGTHVRARACEGCAPSCCRRVRPHVAARVGLCQSAFRIVGRGVALRACNRHRSGAVLRQAAQHLIGTCVLRCHYLSPPRKAKCRRRCTAHRNVVQLVLLPF